MRTLSEKPELQTPQTWFPPEQFTDQEKEVLERYFTNWDRNTFVLTNLPEVVKGAVFSRYSRSSKSARRIFLDEFLQNKDLAPQLGGPSLTGGSRVATANAEAFYERVLVGYGDDSVAELAAAHLACENISSLVGDILTDSRIGISPLEKSARYLLFDKKANGNFLYSREPRIMQSRFAKEYTDLMDELFQTYTDWIPLVISHVKTEYPKEGDVTDRAYESASRAKACDILKNLLPASRLTNVGLHANGRAFEYLLTKLYSSTLAEATTLAEEIHQELRKVIPSFVRRAVKSEYLVETGGAGAVPIHGAPEPRGPMEPVSLVDLDKDALVNVVAAMLFRGSNEPTPHLRELARSMSKQQRSEVISAYFGHRRNRRDKPGRALENAYLTFELCANYGAFRDLHRHRVLTLERQLLGTSLGFTTPPEFDRIGLTSNYRKLMDHVVEVHRRIAQEMPVEAQYAVPRAFRVRWYMKMNVRELYHIVELRSSMQGHPDYRDIAQRMKRILDDVLPELSGPLMADMNEYDLPRLASEKKIDEKMDQVRKKFGP
jgi:thymidylate synthase ThyX